MVLQPEFFWGMPVHKYTVYLSGTETPTMVFGSVRKILSIWSVKIESKFTSQPGLSSFCQPCSEKFGLKCF